MVTNPEERGGISRRALLSRMWWATTGILTLELAGAFVASLWPKPRAGTFGSKFKAGSLSEIKGMPVGSITYFEGGRFYLSRVESGVLALFRKCTHLGCVVPWLHDEVSEDKISSKGRFNCPCHGSIFNRYGEVRGGPAPRPLDLFKVVIEGGQVLVDTGTIITREAFEESQITKI